MASRSPRNVLAPKRISKNLQQAYATNSNASPLMRLPAEIRNRIYREVLAANTIHLEPGSGSSKVEHHVCRAVTNDFDEAKRLQSQHGQGVVQRYDARHAGCQSTSAQVVKPQLNRLSLSILQTCREIHQEAALLAYSDNTFTFGDVCVLTDFLGCLTLAQARSVRSLVVLNRFGHRSTVPVRSRFARLVETRLTGLRNLTCFFELNAYKFVSAKFNSDPHFRQAMADGILQFERCPIEKVVVTALNWRPTPKRLHEGAYRSLISKTEADRWALAIEERLRLPWSETKNRIEAEKTLAADAKEQERVSELERRKQHRLSRGLRLLE